MVVNHLSFDAVTAKRAIWAAWEFTVVGPHLVEVTNASYGYQKDDHTYTVGVEVRDGRPLPAECSCPADVYHDTDCKHKVALATVGGETVLDAAIHFESTSPTTAGQNLKVSQPRLHADGGPLEMTPNPGVNACPNGATHCDGPRGDRFPCFACYCDEDKAENPVPGPEGD